MNKNKENILVPWDFSENAENSLLHAIQLSKVVDNEVVLVHIIDEGSIFSNKDKIEQEIIKTTDKLNTLIEEVYKKHKVKPIVIIKEGNFLKIIKTVIQEFNINQIVMGNEFKLNKRKNIGAKKIIHAVLHNNIPVIITKAPPIHNYYIELVVPLDHSKSYKESLYWIIYLSKYYKCNINIIKPFTADEIKKKRMSNNLFFTKKMLDLNNIVYGIKTAKKDVKFEEDVLAFAHSIEADLIVILSENFNDYLKHQQSKLKKLQTSVMCINPRPDLRKYQSFK